MIRARDLDDALEIANGTEYALTGGLYSRSPANIDRVKREFRVGNIYINRPITGALVDRQPFGGFKLSGIGGAKAGGSRLPRRVPPDPEPSPRTPSAAASPPRTPSASPTAVPLGGLIAPAGGFRPKLRLPNG